MVANKVKGIRATEWYGGNMDIIKLSREHNDANVLSIGARFVSLEEAKKAIELWLHTDFSGEESQGRRHRPEAGPAMAGHGGGGQHRAGYFDA